MFKKIRYKLYLIKRALRSMREFWLGGNRKRDDD